MTEFCVMFWCFYLSFRTGFTKCNAAAINILLLFLAGLFIGLWLRNVPLDKKKSEIIVFKNKLLLVSLLHLAGLCEKSYLMGFRAASRPVSLNNYIAFDVFLVLFQVYTVILHTFVRLKQFIWPSKELKKSLDIFWPQLEKNSVLKNSLVILLFVERQPSAIFLPGVHLEHCEGGLKLKA